MSRRSKPPGLILFSGDESLSSSSDEETPVSNAETPAIVEKKVKTYCILKLSHEDRYILI